MKNKKNKWWNFFKFKFNKSESKHEPMENGDQQFMGYNTTNCRRFVIPVGNPLGKTIMIKNVPIMRLGD